MASQKKKYILLRQTLGDTMKKMVNIYRKGNEFYYLFDGKERGGFSTKAKAKANAKEMNRAKKAGGQKKIATGEMPKIEEDRFRQMGDTRLSKPSGRPRMISDRQGNMRKSEWFDLLKKDPRRAKKARKKRKKGKKSKYKAPSGVYTKPKLRESIHATLLAENTHGTAKGEWSARKSQELNRRYQKRGGGFVNKK